MPLKRAKELLQLGAQLDERGHLGPDAIERTAATVEAMFGTAEAYSPVYRMIGTHACRIAKNRKALVNEISRRTGVQLELIDGHEEARLAGLGMTYLLPRNGKTLLTVDCGGGSTDIATYRDGRPLSLHSIDLGAVTLTQAFVDKNPTIESLHQMDVQIAEKVADAYRNIEEKTFDSTRANSSIAKILFAAHRSCLGESVDLPPDEEPIINHEDLKLAERHLRQLQDPNLLAQALRIDRRRARLAIAGIAIFRALGSEWGISSWCIAATGFREGIVLDTVTRTI